MRGWTQKDKSTKDETENFKTLDVGKTSVSRSTRELFGCFLVEPSRNISLPELFKYSLGPVPVAIATPEGNLVKTVKASLLKELEKNSSDVNVVPCDSIWIVDAIAILQAIKVDMTITYMELAHLVFNTIVSIGMSLRIDWVVDTYPEISIKKAERDCRTTSTAGLLGTTINSENPKMYYQFKKSLLSAQFKQELSQLLLDTSQQPVYTPELSRRSVYVTNGEECHLLQVAMTDRSHITITPVPELRCNYKEADSRLLLHASHAAHRGSSPVALRSPDSDVTVIAIGISHTIPATMLFNTETQQQKRNTQIGSTIGPDIRVTEMSI